MICFSLAILATAAVHADCYIDPVTGRQVCTSRDVGWRSISNVGTPSSESPRVDSSAHCRIHVGDGTVGSGTLIDVDEKYGIVLTCSHLFDGSTDQIVVSFPNGSRFVAQLIDRDRAHDLAALAIRPPQVAPLIIDDSDPSGALTACGFGPNGQFRAANGNIWGQATAVGAKFPSLTMSGAVRPGDSGGGVLNAAGQLVGVVWGQRDGCTYATCGRPLREFLGRIRSRPPVGPTRPSAPAPQIDVAAWTREIEQRIHALDEKKQDKGHYLQVGDLNGYLRVEDAPQIDSGKFAQRAEVDDKLNTVTSRFESVRSKLESLRERAEQIAETKSGFFHGLSFGKLAVGALGLSGPLAIAVIVAGGLAG
jgi:hypothetical protein